jgi:c-di-GMP-binding flagellar brake protein YcgR
MISVVGASLVNVSSYGMIIESPVPLEREAVMRFRLVIAGQKTDVDARVAECNAVPGARRYAVGLEFLRIAPEAQQRLIRVLAGQEPAA